MTELQTTYTETVTAGYPGLIANGETSNRISRTVENSGGIGFGKVAYRGSGDHGCLATQTLVGAGSEQAGNTGTATITDAPTVAAGTKIGRHRFVQLVAGATGEVAGFDPDGIATGNGVVGTEFTLGGITATITTGGSPAIGDTYFVDVTGNPALGITIATQGLGLTSGQTADKYQQYESVGILTEGAIFVTLGGTVADGDPVSVDSNGDFVTGSGLLLPGWVFDQGGADDAVVKIVKR